MVCDRKRAHVPRGADGARVCLEFRVGSPSSAGMRIAQKGGGGDSSRGLASGRSRFVVSRAAGLRFDVGGRT